MKKRCFIILMMIIPFTAIAGEKIVISRWLSTPALEVHYPLFYDVPNVEGNVFTDRQLLLFDHMDLRNYYPEEGKTLTWLNGQDMQWDVEFTDAGGFISITGRDPGDLPEIAYLATYIRADRWMKATLELKSPWMFEAWLNGKKIGTKSTIESKKEKENNNDPDNETGTPENTEPGDNRSDYGRIRHSMELTRGTHLLVIKMLRTPIEGLPWEIAGNIIPEEPFGPNDFSIASTPETIKDILHFMDGKKVSSVRPSPDGQMYAVGYRRSLPPSNRSETWTDIRRFSDGSLVHSFRHASVSRLSWLPATNAVSYTTVNDGKTTIHWHHLETGEKKVILEDIADFAGFRWSPEESYLVYWLREEGSGTDATMRHIIGMQDRQAHFRHRTFLYKLDVASGIRTRLTHGNLSTSLHDISPDGKQLIFSKSRPDYLERPYMKHDIFMVNLEQLTVDTLFADKRWSVSLRFSPDGRSLLATGGPSAFNRAGENIPEGMIANTYDTQAYIVSLDDLAVKPITLDFDPSVVSVYWHATDNQIYLIAGEKDYRRLFRYDPDRDRFERIETGTDYLSSIHFAAGGRMATYIGNRTDSPPRAYSMNLRNNRYEVLEDPDAERYRHVVFGEIYDWTFTASTGVHIDGRVYLPPGFDPEEKYPVIVYQYGGTNPVGRTFGHRYPFNLWAGHGYVVYILQPSGATGYGQAFSAAHVNNWGITVVDEIIEGTQKFLEAHPFTDPERVGLAGASYGGFMTMLVLTHTDMFRTGISHAGISNIASYWGEGYWGYSYSAEATAYSFPWNSREIYVDQSPLFRAHKVNTPLLLVTGDSDTNVPPGESIQMYTALKLLGQPVELILVEGENHHILTYNRRLEWHNAIMAWWDKHLKDQPEWWNDQFPKKNW